MNEPVVVAKAVTKSYGDVVALKDFSFEIARGEMYSLVGANGAGKSTLIKTLTGLVQPDKGELVICGENLSHRLPTTKRHFGYLPEELIFYDRLTGREYLELVAGLKDSNRAEIAGQIDFFELDSVQEKLVGGYSLGMRKKLGLAAAFLGDPDVLILDEPLNGLDVEMMRKLRLKLIEIKASGRSALISSHVMSFVERVSDRVGVMQAGVLVAEASPADLRSIANVPNAPFEDVFFALTSEPSSL